MSNALGQRLLSFEAAFKSALTTTDERQYRVLGLTIVELARVAIVDGWQPPVPEQWQRQIDELRAEIAALRAATPARRPYTLGDGIAPLALVPDGAAPAGQGIEPLVERMLDEFAKITHARLVETVAGLAVGLRRADVSLDLDAAAVAAWHLYRAVEAGAAVGL